MDVMQVILDIENKAQNIVANADDARIRFEEELESEKRRLKLECKRQAELKIDEIKKNILRSEEKQIRSIDNMHKMQSEKLVECFTQNQDRWVKEITNAIINE